MSSEVIYVKERPAICHKCNSHKVAVILYGYPKYDAELQKKVEEGTVVLGGCMTYLDSPNWLCTSCKQKYRKEIVSRLDRFINQGHK